MLPLLFPEIHDHLLCFVDVEVQGEVIFLTPHSEGPHFLPVGRLVIVGNQAYHCSGRFLVWECFNRCCGYSIADALSNELAHQISVFVNVVVGRNANMSQST